MPERTDQPTRGPGRVSRLFAGLRGTQPPTGTGSSPGSRRIVALWVAVAVAAAIQVWAALRRQPPDLLADLNVYVGALGLLRDGGSLYDYAAPGNAAPFTYPPFAAIVLFPIVYVPIEVLRLVWTAGIVAATVVLARLTTGRQIAAAALALLLFAAVPVSSNLRFGQVSLFLVLIVLVDVLGLVPERVRGVLVGLASALKLTPLIFVPYLWIIGQRRAAVTATVTFFVAAGIGWLVLPSDSLRFWTGALWSVERVGNIHNTGNQSVNGALLRLGIDDPARSVLMLLLGGVVVVIAYLGARRLYHRGAPLAAVIVVGAAGLVFSPVSWGHHQVWLVLAALIAVSGVPKWNAVWIAVVAAIMVLPVTRLGDPVTGNLRLFLAVAVACVIPYLGVWRGPALARGPCPPTANTAQNVANNSQDG
jgi:alpha-1,2-mannosyltransferase